MSDASPTAGKGLLERLPWYAVPALLVGIPLLVAVAVQVEPSLYDDVVWQYYWGPIKADAHDDLERCLPASGPDVGDGGPGFSECKSAGGVVAQSGYNVFNTLSWALLLGICIVGAAQMLRRLRTPMDNRLILGASAWVVAGSIFHVAEDVGTFQAPLQYLFITPTIYLLFAAFGILAFLVGHYLKWVAERAGLARAMEKLWFLHAILVLAWLVIWLKVWDQVAVIVHPLWVAGFAALTFLVTRRLVMKAGRVDPTTLTLSLSLGAFLLAVLYVVKFADQPWGPPGDLATAWRFDWGIANPGADPSMPLAFLYAPALALAVALAV
ncbi:MAG TPA: DUF63 family protein, partial [Candidatus Thermoplasmatota archaeon]|nr:DUF63 family protein [Candidatus Thermoplasmatota archaeon]